mmetsp:Transcript_20383/g.63339  ORF Transcript_20383/g.63339 Transcript_20383/m.63339 type:complete len:209 (+) Transcript_20383:650-1276(+)
MSPRTVAANAHMVESSSARARSRSSVWRADIGVPFAFSPFFFPPRRVSSGPSMSSSMSTEPARPLGSASSVRLPPGRHPSQPMSSASAPTLSFEPVGLNTRNAGLAARSSLYRRQSDTATSPSPTKWSPPLSRNASTKSRRAAERSDMSLTKAPSPSHHRCKMLPTSTNCSELGLRTPIEVKAVAPMHVRTRSMSLPTRTTLASREYN